jgi:hypothetical protein
MAAEFCLPPRLVDGEVVLDSYRAADAEAHFAGEDEEMRLRFEAPGPSTLEQTRNAIFRWSARCEPSIVNYAMRDRTGRLLGGCEARRTSDTVVEVSYWVFPVYCGLGMAARALALLADGSGPKAALSGSRPTSMPTTMLPRGPPSGPASSAPVRLTTGRWPAVSRGVDVTSTS